MPISCECGGGEYDWYYNNPDDYSKAPVLKRRKRCCSCKTLINGDDLVAELVRWKENDDGLEFPLASWWLCEECADIAFSLIEYGYCITWPTDLRDDLKVHADYYAAKESLRASNEALSPTN